MLTMKISNKKVKILKVMNIFKRYLFIPRRLSSDILEKLPTHELLQSLGYIKQSHSGLVHWLPLGLEVLRSIESIIRFRMNESGGFEVSLSTLSSKLLWEKTNRWSNKELFKLKDSKNKDYCLVATCEEEITSLMKQYIGSYNDLPLLVYQISRKYRDELRPRGGLLRGREFVMKDGYSFHSDSKSAILMFDKMNEVYNNIFQDIKLPFVSAVADSGDIGGDLSREYHYEHKSGEDELLSCNKCKSIHNIEKCMSLPKNHGNYTGSVNVKYMLNENHDTLICLYYPSNRVLNWNLVLDCIEKDIDMRLKHYSNEEVLSIFQNQKLEPILQKFTRIIDCRLNSRSNFPDFPLTSYLKNNFSQLNDFSIVNSVEGEVCGKCESGLLKGSKSIEIAHTFYLGKKYTDPLNALVRNSENTTQVMEMGCYGIGVTRLVGAIAQVTRDDYGLCWPSPVAPYKLSLNFITNDDNVQRVYKSLNYVPFIDSTNVSLNNKLQLSHQLGIPLAVIVGKKHWPLVEIEVRGKFFTTTWRSEYELNKTQYMWEVDETSNVFMKHYCHHHQLNKVISILLKDL